MSSSNKDEFIGKYLDKHMKGHGLPWSMAYYNLLSKTMDKAELAWKVKQRKLNKTAYHK